MRLLQEHVYSQRHQFNESLWVDSQVCVTFFLKNPSLMSTNIDVYMHVYVSKSTFLMLCALTALLFNERK